MLLRLRMLLPYVNIGLILRWWHKRQQFVKRTRVTFNNRFVVAGTQQLDSAWKILKKWQPIAFAQKDKSYGGTNENHWKWARSFQWRHNASITSSILEELPACLRQSWKKMRPSRKDMEIIDEEQFPNLFSQCDKKKKGSFRLPEIQFSQFLNWPTQYKMTLSKCLPNTKNVKKTLGFQHFTLRMMKKNWSTVPGRRVSRFPCFLAASSLVIRGWLIYPLPSLVLGAPDLSPSVTCSKSICFGRGGSTALTPQIVWRSLWLNPWKLLTRIDNWYHDILGEREVLRRIYNHTIS